MSISSLLASKEDNIDEMTYNVLWQKYLMDWREKSDRNRISDSFHASSLADKKFCVVKAVIDEVVKKKDEAMSPSTLAIFMNGVDVHRKHQKFYEDIGISLGIEKVYYSNFLKMYATPDAIIKFLNCSTIVEIKSMRSTLFNRLKEVPYNAYCQSQIYMYITGIPQAIIVIENKDDQRLKVYKIDFNINDAYRLIRYRVVVLACLEKKIIPIKYRICDKPSKKCKYSKYCFDEKALNKIKDRM